MGKHDKYGKDVIEAVNGGSLQTVRRIQYGRKGGSAYIDGVIGKKIAIEIESRTAKQIRGAILDLMCHEYEKKLLILIDAGQGNVGTIKNQAESIFKLFGIKEGNFRIVALKGKRNQERRRTDKKLINNGVQELS